jgi:type IV pilus biogenesis protein CpaD/CtpE
VFGIRDPDQVRETAGEALAMDQHNGDLVGVAHAKLLHTEYRAAVGGGTAAVRVGAVPAEKPGR